MKKVLLWVIALCGLLLVLFAGAGFRLRSDFEQVDQFVAPVSNAVLALIVIVYVWRLITHKPD